MTAETLLPGYKQVESFGPDEEYEDDEEVSYVTLDLGPSIEPTLAASSSTYRLIGLDTPTPFLQLSGTILKGQHDLLIGSEIIFTEDKSDETDRSKRSAIPVTTTEQRIRFKEVQLKPKEPDLATSPSDPFIHENPARPADASNANPRIAVDRITGKSVPAPTRAPKGKAKKKGKQKAAVIEEEKEVGAEGGNQDVRDGDITMAEEDQDDVLPKQGDPMDIAEG